MRFLFVCSLLLGAVAAFAQPKEQLNLLNDVRIDQRLGEPLPLEATFKDESGREVKLGEYFQKNRPVVLALIYYRCPSLCNQILNGMLAAFRIVKYDIGKDFDVVCISIDPRETPDLAAAKKKSYIESYHRPSAESGWHFLTGTEDQIKKVADAVGYHYKYVPESDIYAHAAGIVVCTPEGKLGQYFYGIEYSPRELELALTESSQGQIGNLVDAITLWCTVYDPATGSYQFLILRVIQVAGILTVLILGTFIVRNLRAEKGTRRMDENDLPKNGSDGGSQS
ncbi:MAG: electron transporter SenC [Fimbriimonadales bacterium]|nr:MAG: electron transporter SenC [Fimbriimonadales bacterium]